MEGLDSFRDLGVAIAGGLLIGIERGWRLREEAPGTRVAGVRTFALAGGLGGASAIAGRQLDWAVAAIIVAGAVAMLVMAHLRAMRRPREMSATSLVAILLALSFGLIAGAGAPALALAGAAVTTLILSLRTELHGLVGRLGEADIKALAKFAIIAGAILPFLPDERFGPYEAWNPFRLWIVVVLVTGISFVAYTANRLVGVKRGTLATAVIAGGYSSTAVTVVLAHRLYEQQEGGETLAAGIVLASAVSLGRVMLLTAILASFASAALALLIAPAAIVAAVAGIALARQAAPLDSPATAGNPINLVPALAFLVLVALMSLGVRWAEAEYGSAGVALLTLIVGIFDVDAAIVTLGGLGEGTIAVSTTALILASAVFANMAFKLMLILGYAGWHKGRTAFVPLLVSTAIIAASVAAYFWRYPAF